jgi:peptide chain release factor 1
MLDIVDKLEEQLADLDRQMADPEVIGDQKKLIELTRERRRVESILEVGYEYRKVKTAVDEAKEIMKNSNEEEMIDMAREELEENEPLLEPARKKFELALLPPDPDDNKPAMVEIRAGTGGDEAGLFAGDLFRMYQRYADQHEWKLEIMNSHPANAGGFKEVVFSLDGDQTFGRMKYESGVHRVQRVPETETQGRIHTSAVSVAVFPQAAEVDIEINPNDLKIDVYRSSGPGGQSVNTTDSAVRITHQPTGLVVTCQDEKSQIKNRKKAMTVLRSRLYDRMMSEKQAKMAAERRSMVSTGDRSAKIRTYNYPQSRVTDHRISLTLYKLEDILNGQVDLLIEELRQHDQQERLKLQAAGEEV